jgi:hypothetical protein
VSHVALCHGRTDSGSGDCPRLHTIVPRYAVSMTDWFQDPQKISKSEDTEVLYIK